jgi:hypothetical protein
VVTQPCQLQHLLPQVLLLLLLLLLLLVQLQGMCLYPPGPGPS